MMPQNIPTVYRVWFAWVDPISVIPTIYAMAFDQEFFFRALTPGSTAEYDPTYTPVFHQVAALYLYLALTQWFVLRAVADIKVWRIIEASVLAVDIAILVSLYVMQARQERLNPSVWTGQDWANWGITCVVAVVRSLFLAGVGMKAEDGPETDRLIEGDGGNYDAIAPRAEES